MKIIRTLTTNLRKKNCLRQADFYTCCLLPNPLGEHEHDKSQRFWGGSGTKTEVCDTKSNLEFDEKNDQVLIIIFAKFRVKSWHISHQIKGYNLRIYLRSHAAILAFSLSIQTCTKLAIQSSREIPRYTIADFLRAITNEILNKYRGFGSLAYAWPSDWIVQRTEFRVLSACRQ